MNPLIRTNPIDNSNYSVSKDSSSLFSICYNACLIGDLKQVQDCIIKNSNLFSQLDEEGQNLLYACAVSNQLVVMEWLYEQNPQALKICRSNGQTLMHIAAELEHVEIIQWLHEKDQSLIEQVGNNQLNPIQQAAFLEKITTLKFFAEKIKANKPLIQQIAQKNCPKTLAFLLEQGIDPNSMNASQQTLLHLAAEAGQEKNVLCLLQHKAKVDLSDRSKRTPIFLAVIQNHISIVNLLIRKKANITTVNEENETLLHIAATYGHKKLLQELLAYPACKNLIEAKDLDGKTALHKAVWGDPKPEIVKLLMEHEADPNAINNYGYTPLHWAAKHGHIESAQTLLKRGDLLKTANVNNHLPFDLALRFDQDDFVHFFLGTKARMQVGKPSQDIEGFYSKCLLQAKHENLVEEQIFFLQKLSALYIEKENFLVGAKILNCALALLDKKNQVFESYIFKRLEEIEKLFIANLGLKASFKIDGNIEKRARLAKIRKTAAESNKPIQNILRGLTREFKQLLSDLIAETQELLGPSPVNWACLGMGSMSRGEMCPYSDIEFAFVIEKESIKALEYFRTLAKILEVKVINLGETKFPVFGGAHESPTPDGFCMDSAGNTPLGVTGIYELIGTPKQLAQFQSVKWMERNIILPNAMSNVCFVAGNQKLEASYNKQKKKVQQRQGKKEGMLRKNDEELAMRLLGGHLIEFSPDLSIEKEKETAFGVKKELYRPFQEILGCLSLLYGLQEKSTFGRIDELMGLNVFSPEGAENLKKAINLVLSLRLQVHLFYKDEKEFLCHPEEGKIQDPTLYYFNEKDIECLHEIYKVLLPFHKSASKFYKTKNKEVLNKSIFYDDSPSVKATTFKRTLQYEKAQEAYQNAISLNPNDIFAQLALGSMEYAMGKAKQALLRNMKGLELAQQNYGENHLYVGASYNNIGLVYQSLGENEKALEFYLKDLQISIKILGENHPIVATNHNNISGVYRALGNFVKALEHYQKALDICLQVYGKNHPSVAKILNNIGVIGNDVGGSITGIDFLKMSLEIQIQILGESHPDVSTTYNNIGLAYVKQGESSKALEFHQKALKIQLQILGENHSDVGTSYTNIGGIYLIDGEHCKALEFFEKALKIQLQIQGENHLAVGTNYSYIGGVYDSLGEYAKALEFYQKDLKIQFQILGENHYDVAKSYGNIAGIYLKSGDFCKALDFDLKSLKILIQFFGENHPDVGTSYNNIGCTYETLGDYGKALESHQKALKIRLQVLGENHPDLAMSYDNIGKIYNSLENYDNALDHFQTALKIRLQALSENHPDMATIYNNIGAVYDNLGNHEKALEFHQKSLKIMIHFFGENHLSVASIYSNIGNVYNHQKNYEKALEFYQKSLKIDLQFLDENHPSMATRYNNIGTVYKNLWNITKRL